MGESQVANEWRAEGLRKGLLKILLSRFHVLIPADLMSAINAQADPTELDRWMDTAFATPSLEEFRAAIGQ
jgi:hypothetical protein